ncbi:MAG: hypothetical protein ACR2HL_08995 [Methylocystis sp.]
MAEAMAKLDLQIIRAQLQDSSHELYKLKKIVIEKRPDTEIILSQLRWLIRNYLRVVKPILDLARAFHQG